MPRVFVETIKPRFNRVFGDSISRPNPWRNNYSSLDYTPEIASFLNASYRKFTKITTKYFIEEEIEEQITVSEWEDGELVEIRIYRDEFDSGYFDSSELTTITNLDSGQEIELPIGYSPSFLDNSREGWARDGVSEKFDQVFIISPDREVEIINIHQENITINIQTRFSPYHDHLIVSQDMAVQDTQFEVTGVLFAPADGQVYYTSDREAFKSGDAKTRGLYFYYDSDLDNFYETVYVLAPDDDNDGVYDVMAIGYNSDSKHSFALYEKVGLEESIISRDDYEHHISTETVKYSDNWVYNFAKLKKLKTLFPEETYDGYEPKDDFFEVWKLLKTSDKNSKFSQLFYEVRHKEYDKTWNDYSAHFWSDVGDQVFATLVASGISLAIIVVTEGIGTPLAHLAYFGVYSLISKFQMDMKAKQAEAKQRSETFYPEGADRNEPASLNQKYIADEFWGDSMPAALAGHPGAYYTTVMGGEIGSQYTAQAIVSPPNEAKFWNWGNFPGLLDYLGHNVGTFGAGDPDKFTPLDFDNHNLDFQLVSSELYAYNDEPHYTYLEDPALIDLLFDSEPNYKRYTPVYGQEPMLEYVTGPEYVLDQIKLQDSYLFRQNTLGYLTKKIRQASNGDLTTIRATCQDGEPQYVFTSGDDTVPKSALFQPLIVSPDRYEELENRGLVDGYIVIDVQAPYIVRGQSIDTQGIDSKQLTAEERGLYNAKIPLADIFGGFEYPIKSVEVFGINSGQVVDSRLLTTSEYDVSLGNLYLTKSLGQLVPLYSQEFYYKFVIQVAKIIPDDGTEEATRSALGIATAYAVMDYFDQYTYSKTSAQMIAEVGYTEIMTITSTAISAPAVALGSWAVSSAQQATAEASKVIVGATAGQQVSQQAAKFALKSLIFEIGKRAVIGTIKETIEEIVIDGFFETAIQSAVRMTGGSDAAGHWISTLFTSVRETANFRYLTGTQSSSAQGFAGQVQRAMDLSTDFESIVSELKVENEGMSDSQIAAANEQFLTAKMAEMNILVKSRMDDKISIGRIFATGIFTGLALIVPSLAGFNLYAISKLVGGIGTRINAKSQNKFLAARNAKMFLKHAIEVQKQKTELGKKPIVTQPETNLPKNIPKVSILPEGADSLLEQVPVEAAVAGNNYMTRLGFFDESGRPMRPAQINQRILHEIKVQEIREEKARVEQNQEQIIALDGGISEKGDLKVILEGLKDKYNDIEFNSIRKELIKYQGVFYSEQLVLDIEGFNGAINYHILKAINEKIQSKKQLTDLEVNILNSAILLEEGPNFDARYRPLYYKFFWEEGTTSPYYGRFKTFMESLVKSLYQLEVIESQELSSLDKILKVGTIDGLQGFINALEQGREWNLLEATLDKWFVKIETEIRADLSILDKDNAIRTVAGYFNSYLRASGYEAKNPFYRPLRLMVLRIGSVLLDSGVITKNDYDHIGELIHSPSKCYNLWENVKKNPNAVPDPGASVNFLNLVLEYASTSLSLQQIEQIERYVTSFVQLIVAHKGGQDHLSRYPECPRKELVSRIMSKLTFLNIAPSKAAISRILFGKSEYLDRNFLDTRHTSSKDPTPRLLKRPDITKVWRIILTSLKWTPQTFLELGITLSRSDIDYLRRETKAIVDDWIFENHYSVNYIYETPRRRINSYKFLTFDQYYLSPEYELIQYLWLTCAIHENNPSLSMGGKSSVVQSFGYKEITDILVQGKHDLSADSLKKILLKLNEWAGQEAESATFSIAGIPISDKLAVYSTAMDKIEVYMKERGKSFIKPDKKSFYNRKLWFDELSRAYHAVFLFARQLGFDPLTFMPLVDSIFKGTPVQRSDGRVRWLSRYIRHHLKRNGKESVLLHDLALTDVSTHNYWNNIDEADAREILHRFSLLINKNGPITKADITKTFSGEYEWVLNNPKTGWFSNKDFDKNLADFNSRKETYKSNNGIEKLMRKWNYNNLINRFYKKVLDDKMRSLILFTEPPYSGLRDYSDFLAIDFYTSKRS